MAAAAEIDEASRLLLRFYALECGLKAIFMDRFHLKSTDDSNLASGKSAVDFKHNVEALIKHLKISPRVLPTSVPTCHDKEGNAIPASDLHQIWRYGGYIRQDIDVKIWLDQAIGYVLKELY